MFRFFPSFPAVVGLAFLVMLGGCGQKGPLYMPQQGKKPASAPIRTVGPSATMPAPDSAEVLMPSTAPDSQ